MLALKRGLELSLAHRPVFESLRICTDSLSAIKSLQSGPLSQQCSTGADIWTSFAALRCKIQLVHVPAHVGLTGNEEADRQAASGSNERQDGVPIDLPTAKATIKRKLRTIYGGLLREDTGPIPSQSAARFWQHMRPVAVDHLPRRMQTAIRRLRSNHSISTAAYRHRIGLVDSDMCSDCLSGKPDTADHLILECPKWTMARMRHFDTATPTIDVLNDPTSVAGFLEETGRIPA
jgi:hypothetical protein